MPPRKKQPARRGKKQDTPVVGKKSTIKQTKLKLPPAMRAGVASSVTNQDDSGNSPPERSPRRPPSIAETVVAPTRSRASSRSPTRQRNLISSTPSTAAAVRLIKKKVDNLAGRGSLMGANVSPIRNRPQYPPATPSSTHSSPERSSRAPSSNATPRGQNTSRKRKSTLLPQDVFKRRYRPPDRALREIQFYQRSTDSLIPKAPFARLVRELTINLTGCATLRYRSKALDALHQAAEAYIVGFFEDAFLLALHAKRVTLQPKDLALAYRIRGDNTAAYN